jgi:hypothetical protein
VRRHAVVLAVLVVALAAAVAAGADSITPVRLSIHISPVARRAQPLPARVVVSADPGALDAGATVWMRVKLAPECGGTFAGTRGDVLIDRPLSPQPATGRAYAGAASGSGRPRRYGTETVCVFLESAGDEREYATSQSVTLDVSRACTIAAARYDDARRRHRGAAAARARRDAVRACGPGVAL